MAAVIKLSTRGAPVMMVCVCVCACRQCRWGVFSSCCLPLALSFRGNNVFAWLLSQVCCAFSLQSLDESKLKLLYSQQCSMYVMEKWTFHFIDKAWVILPSDNILKNTFCFTHWNLLHVTLLTCPNVKFLINASHVETNRREKNMESEPLWSEIED